MPKKNTAQPHLLQPDTTKSKVGEPDALAALHRPLTKADIDKVRHIEGFPIGSDEDIIALSDPPYYTACPNPFLEDFIRAYGRPYDEATDTYHREPFAADVSEGKNDPIYNAHGYHTKVPHKAIMRYILHYTEPGDIVFDGFCGTGMTGVAAQMCGAPDPDFKKVIAVEMPDAKWGARYAILGDLSPLATFIAYNYNAPIPSIQFEKEASRILREIQTTCGWMYETLHSDGKSKGKINYTVWSDVFVCPNCNNEIVFTDVALDKQTGKVLDVFACPHCSTQLTKSMMDRSWRSVIDKASGQVIRVAKQAPVLINYSVDGKKYEKKPTKLDLQLIERIGNEDIPYWYPIQRMCEGNESRRNDDIGLTHVHHFYTTRSLRTLATLFHFVGQSPLEIRRWLMYAFEQAIMGMSKWARYVPTHYSQVNQGLSGTLYIGSQVVEPSLQYISAGKIQRLAGVLQSISSFHRSKVAVTTQSATAALPDVGMSVDYIFTDPPFGSNLMYAELNFIMESWLRITTNSKQEAVMNPVQTKGLADIQFLMEQCFQHYYQLLKPGRWMTVEFHNSKNSIWNAIQEAILRVGFVVADVRTLDKQHGTFKQITASGAVKQDLVISAYKPMASFEKRFMLEAGTAQGAWDFVRQHLVQLPIFVSKDDVIEVVTERQNYLLFDRMVAFHIQRGVSVPLNASEFYAGLRQRFPERDGMYFLPEQVTEYDIKRAEVTQVEQLSLFVSDEKSAVQWLRMELERERQTYQDLQPKFLQELHQARHEQLPELGQMLAENFLRDNQDRWFVPNPEKGEDLEKLRERNLLREYETYKQAKGKLRIFRTEAVRAGFKDAWGKRDYKTIIQIAQRLPEDVLQEDPMLLMYYDNSVMRSEG